MKNETKYIGQIDAKELMGFFKKIDRGGSVDFVNLVKNKERIDVKAMSIDQLTLCLGHLKKSVFMDYAPDEFNIPLPDLGAAIKTLARFVGETKLELADIDGFKVLHLITENKTGTIPLTDEDLGAEVNLPKVDYGKNTLVIEKQFLVDVIKDAEALDVTEISIDGVDGELVFTCKNDEGGRIAPSIKKTVNDFKHVMIDTMKFKSIVDTLTGDSVVLMLMNDVPICIEETCEHSYMKHYLAPRIPQPTA